MDEHENGSSESAKDPGDRAVDDYKQVLLKERDLRDAVLNTALAQDLGPPTPELYFATVRAIGTPVRSTVVRPLEQALRAVGFLLRTIKISDVMGTLAEREGEQLDVSSSLLARYRTLTKFGEDYCERRQRRDALVLEAVRELHDRTRRISRQAARDDPHTRLRGVAYLFRNLMHPEEVSRLRKLYGDQLFVISVFSPEDVRHRHLSLQLANGDPMRMPEMQAVADELIYAESGRVDPALQPRSAVDRRYRMNIPATWEHADLFLDASDTARLGEQIERLVQLIFSHPFRTPRPEEIGMSEAFNAALESSNLARPVGAAITAPTQELLAIGTNSAPRPGGGIYRGGVAPDHRDHTSGWAHDPSDSHRKSILRDLIERLLADPGWLRELGAALGADDNDKAGAGLAETILAQAKTGAINASALVDYMIRSGAIRQSQFFDVVEYGRTLHAEMDALTSAARKTVSVRDGTLYCTTLPCHECARLIIGAGIKRVIFIEPYEKSRAMALYRTEIVLRTMAASTRDPNDKLVHFIPYVGISPRRFTQLFSWIDRKQDDLRCPEERRLDGAIVEWDAKSAPIRETIVSNDAFFSVSRFVDLLLHEQNTLREFDGVHEDDVREEPVNEVDVRSTEKTGGADAPA